MQANNVPNSNFLAPEGKRGLNKGNSKAKSNENFIGVPPDMTESADRR